MGYNDSMAYEKTDWQAREGAGLNKFTKSGETETAVYLDNTPDSVKKPGTPFTPQNMNHIEEGIAAAHEGVDAEAAARERGDAALAETITAGNTALAEAVAAETAARAREDAVLADAITEGDAALAENFTAGDAALAEAVAAEATAREQEDTALAENIAAGDAALADALAAGDAALAEAVAAEASEREQGDNALQKQINTLMPEGLENLPVLLDKKADKEEIHPVGSIYLSVVDTNPALLFGGTWTEWGKGRVLVGVDENQTEFDTVEKTGGAKTHALTTSEMPSHTHTGPSHTHNLSNHTHSFPHTHGVTLPQHTHTFAHTHNIGWTIGYSNWGTAPGLARTDYAAGQGSPTDHCANEYKTVNQSSSTTGNASTTSGAATNTQSTETSGGPSNNTSGASGTGDTGSAGSWSAHNNLQPYITCYMWKRTA